MTGATRAWDHHLPYLSLEVIAETNYLYEPETFVLYRNGSGSAYPQRGNSLPVLGRTRRVLRDDRKTGGEGEPRLTLVSTKPLNSPTLLD